MPDPKVYQHDAICTVNYDGLYCEGPCPICDTVGHDRADEAAYNRREDFTFRAWLDGLK